MMGQKSLVRNMASLQKFLHILFRLIFLSREMDSTPPSENRAKSCAEPLLNSDSVRHSLDSSLMDLHSRSKLVVGGELRVHRCIPLLGIHRRSKRWFSVDSGLEKLCWRKKNSRGKFKTINSSCIVDLIQGTKLFRSKISSQAEEIIQDRTFSIVLEYGQLDLEAESQRDREEWIFALKWLQNWNRDRIGRPFNFRHLSHVNSEYKWKGGTLEDSFELLDLMGKGAYGKVYRAKHKSNGFQIAVKVIEPIKEDMWFLDAEISKARQSHHSISMPENLIDVEEHHPVGNHTESHISSLFKEFINEVDILKQCRHQNIVNFYGCGVDQNNRLWILMDLCEFGSLRSLLSAKVHRKVNLLHRLTPHYSGTTTVSLTSKSSSGKNSADQSIAAFNTNSDSLPAFQETIHGRLKRKKLEDLIAFAMFSIIQALIYLHENHILHRDIKAGNILISKNGV